jgi:hypothetical protein
LYFDKSPHAADKEITVLTEEDEECSVEIDCQSKENQIHFDSSQYEIDF